MTEVDKILRELPSYDGPIRVKIFGEGGEMTTEVDEVCFDDEKNLTEIIFPPCTEPFTATDIVIYVGDQVFAEGELDKQITCSRLKQPIIKKGKLRIEKSLPTTLCLDFTHSSNNHMQELIPKKSAIEILYKILDNDFYPDHNNCKYSPSMCADVRDVFKKFGPLLDTLSPVVHHEYKVGEVYEFYDDGEWVKGKLSGFHKESGFRYVYLNIRPLQSEHPDITQARELASKHGYSITKI